MNSKASELTTEKPWLFRKGQSGNPKGRPPGFSALIRRKVGANGERLIELLLQIAEGELCSEALELIHGDLEEIPIAPTIRERLDAIKLLAEHGFGKPAARVELSGPGGGPLETRSAVAAVNLGAYSDAQLAQLEGLLALGSTPALPEHVEGEVLAVETGGDDE